jgi:hypothetical protein
MEALPLDSIVRHGLRDGADAAHRAWARTHGDEAAEAEMELPVEAAEVAADML